MSQTIQSYVNWYAVSTGSSNAYVVTLDSPLTTLETGMTIHMKANFANTGAATVNVNSLGAKSIKNINGSDLSAGGIPSNGIAEMVYDGTNFQLLGSTSADEELDNINTSNIFRTCDEIQELASSPRPTKMEKGWVDSFGTSNDQGADEANSTSEQYDGTNDLYKGADGGTSQNADQNYATEANYETYDYSGTTASISTNTITISSGTFPSNAVGMRFSPENPFNPANSAAIETYTDSTHIVLVSGHGLTASNSAWTLRSFQISSGVAKLSGFSSSTLKDSGATADDFTDAPVGNNSTWFKAAQGFTTTSAYTIAQIKLRVKKVGYPSDNFQVSIRATSGGTPTGGDLTSVATLAGGSITTSYAWYTFTFTSTAALSNSTVYSIYLTRSGSQDGSNYFQVSRSSGNSGTTYRDSDGTPTWTDVGSRAISFETYSLDLVNAISEYVPIIPTYANLADVSNWTDVNSLARTETPNSASIFYAYFTNAQSGWGANTALSVFNGSNVERPIVRNNAGTWQYNSDTVGTPFSTTTWANATINTLAGALRQAATIALNQMSGATMAGVADSALNVPTGKAGIVAILYSTVNSNNPQVDQTRVNYDSQRAAMDLRSKTYDPNFVPNKVFLWAKAEHSDADGPGAFYVTRDGGTNWTSVTMTQQGKPLSGNIKLLRGILTFTSEPSGQDVRCRYVTTAGKDQFLHAWGLQARL